MSNKRRRNLLIVGTNYSPELTGIGPYTALLAGAAADGGFEVQVITGVPHYPEWHVQQPYRRKLATRERMSEVDVLRVRHFVPRHPDLKGRAGFEGSFLAASIGPTMLAKADAIVAITPSLAGLAAATLGRRRRPLGVVVQDLTGAAAAQTGAAGGRASSAIARSEMSMLRRADLVGVVASEFATSLVDVGLDPAKILDLPNPSRVEGSTVSPAEARQLLGWPTGRPLVVHTGNMGLKQGLEHVIEAASVRPDIDFALVGDGGQRRELEAQAADLGIKNLKFVPPVSQERYPIVLAAADVLVLSEAPTVEAMSLPSKITSYVAAKRPIVAAVRGGGITANYLNQHGIAHVVDSSGPSLAEGIDEVLADGELRCSFLKAQGEMLDSLSPARAAKRYVEFVERLFELRQA